MATYTSHLNLKLPDYSDTADINDLNDNFKKIDDAIASGGTETDPTVPAWAKKPSKPTYTADEVGADAAGTAAAQVGAHNVSGEAHADLRALIEGLTNRLNALADSDDTTLDQLSEIVAYIKSNKALIDAVTTGKVSVSDIVDNLMTNESGKVLSAAQGVALKAMIDGIVIPTALPNPQPITINGQRYDGSEAVTVTTAEIDDTLTQSGKAADAKAVGDQLSALNEANAAQDTRLTALENVSGIAVRPLKTENMGELFEQPETYLAWFQGCLKYDPDVGCPVGVISGMDGHGTGTGKAYFIKIEPKTGEVTKTVAGQYDDDDTYGCFTQSFYIDNNGTYTFYAGIQTGWDEIEQRKYISTDKGATWTYTDVSGQTFPIGSIIKLKSGLLIGLCTYGSNVRNQAIYSDNNGETWTKGQIFSGCTEVEIIELKNSLIAIGRKNLTYTAPIPAVLYYSTDDGLTWTGGKDSATLADMCNPCSGVYWEKEELLELFYCSRYANGNTGTIYHAYANLEDALADNFTVDAIGESKQESAGIDFGYCATACDQDESAWVIYYDHADSGKGTNLNLILANKTCVTIPVVKSEGSMISLYSAKIVDKKLAALRSDLIAKINEAILGGGGSGGDPGGGGDSGGGSGGELNGTTYVTDGLYSYFNFDDETKYDASTSKWTPVIGSNSAFVVTAYNNMTGIGAAKPEGSPGIFYIDTTGLPADTDFSIEWVETVKANGKSVCSALNSISWSDGEKLKVSTNSVSGKAFSGSTWTDSQGGTHLQALTNPHVVLTYTHADNTFKMYVNNTLNLTLTTTSNPMSNYISNKDGVPKGFYRIYSKALSAEEIGNNYTYEKKRLGIT